MSDSDKIKRLREAIRPFVDYEKQHIDAWRGDEEGVVVALNNDPDHDEVFTTRAFRDLRDAWEQTKGE